MSLVLLLALSCAPPDAGDAPGAARGLPRSTARVSWIVPDQGFAHLRVPRTDPDPVEAARQYVVASGWFGRPSASELVVRGVRSRAGLETVVLGRVVDDVLVEDRSLTVLMDGRTIRGSYGDLSVRALDATGADVDPQAMIGRTLVPPRRVWVERNGRHVAAWVALWPDGKGGVQRDVIAASDGAALAEGKWRPAAPADLVVFDPTPTLLAQFFCVGIPACEGGECDPGAHPHARAAHDDAVAVHAWAADRYGVVGWDGADGPERVWVGASSGPAGGWYDDGCTGIFLRHDWNPLNDRLVAHEWSHALGDGLGVDVRYEGEGMAVEEAVAHVFESAWFDRNGSDVALFHPGPRHVDDAVRHPASGHDNDAILTTPLTYLWNGSLRSPRDPLTIEPFGPDRTATLVFDAYTSRMHGRETYFSFWAALATQIFDHVQDGDPGWTLDDLCTLRNAFSVSGVVDGDHDCDLVLDGLDDDDDGDGVPDGLDVCPTVYDPDQSNVDGDATGDACDADIDGDGLLGWLDPCPDVDGPPYALGPAQQPVILEGGEDVNDNGVADWCDDPDVDDLPVHEGDNCPDHWNPNQADLDGDGRGDACDPDDDGDGITDLADRCPRVRGSGTDADRDGVGSVCDNCPDVANPDQWDFDLDRLGNACDDDDDDDGVPDVHDNCPGVRNADQMDGDHDGVGTACDLDETRGAMLKVEHTVMFRDLGVPLQLPIPPCAGPCPDWMAPGEGTELVVRSSEPITVLAVDDLEGDVHIGGGSVKSGVGGLPWETRLAFRPPAEALSGRAQEHLLVLPSAKASRVSLTLALRPLP